MKTKIKIVNKSKKVEDFEDIEVGDYFEIGGVLVRLIIFDGLFLLKTLSCGEAHYGGLKNTIHIISELLEEGNAKRVKSVKIEYEVG